jgi:hypothetical protein
MPVAEDATMLRECQCHGTSELCAAWALGVSGVAGRGSTVPDSHSNSFVSICCCPSLVLLVLVLVLVLVLASVPSTCSLVSSVLWCLSG